jgi:hypothetical protein
MKTKNSASKENIFWLLGGILLIIVGFIFLGQGPADNEKSLTVAPLLLTFAYLIVIPIGIMVGGRKKKGD